MPTSEKLQIPPENSEAAPKSFWVCLALLFLAVILFHGKTVPFSNEFLYLLRLDANFLPNDWTFSAPANEHWFFNLIFSLPARFFSLELIAWTGRIVCWVLSLIALLKLGKSWKIAYWKIAVSIFLWLAFAQAAVNDEWIFGGFEAKVVAYLALLFSLAEFTKRKIVAPSVLLGLAFSFHPAVGLWTIPAVGLALLFERIPFTDFAKIVVISGLFSLFGLIPLLAEQTSAVGSSFDDWKFIVLYRVPWHLDVFQFSASGTILIFVMLLFNCLAVWRSEHFALRFLLKFQIALGVFFLLGAAIRWLEIFPLLRLMPMRLFPVFTPLFFIFTAFHLVGRLTSKQHKLVVGLFAASVVALLNPLEKGSVQVRETIQSWSSAPDDMQAASRWIAENTSADAVVIQPPHRRDFWYFSRRASVASFAYPTFSRLSEWRTRISDLTADLHVSKGETAGEEIETAYNRLSQEQIEFLKTKYAATHLVSRAVYSYPIIFATETYKVYRLL